MQTLEGISHKEVRRRSQELEREKKELTDDRARHAEALEKIETAREKEASPLRAARETAARALAKAEAEAAAEIKKKRAAFGSARIAVHVVETHRDQQRWPHVAALRENVDPELESFLTWSGARQDELRDKGVTFSRERTSYADVLLHPSKAFRVTSNFEELNEALAALIHARRAAEELKFVTPERATKELKKLRAGLTELARGEVTK